MPTPVLEDVLITGVRQSLRGVPRFEHLHQVLHRFVRTGPIRLVHDQQVGDLDDAGLDGLNVVARSRNGQQTNGVDDAHHVDLLLTHAHRLHQDHVEAHRIEHADDATRGTRQSARLAAIRHASDEDTRVEIVLAHANAIAEDRAAGIWAGRIDRDDGNTRHSLSIGRGERRHQRALACARRPGEAPP